MNANQAKFLAGALAQLIGPATEGGIAFTRCLPSHTLAALAARPEFKIPGWNVRVVAGRANANARIITADQAVEVRESKGDAMLLLVDVDSAGAGMDGIYNAAKEIAEQELFAKAIAAARKALPRQLAEIATEAVRRAKKLGQRHTVSPWREFEFYCYCAENPAHIGGALTILNLWPVEFGATPDAQDIGKSVLMVERLLLPPASSRTPASRVASLMLHDVSDTQRGALEQILRQAGAKPLGDILAEVDGQPELRLNRLKPSFSTDKLTRIELINWRGRNGKPAKWSGLEQPDPDDLPQLILDREKGEGSLSVRWNTFPEEIAKGTVTYEVLIVVGPDDEDVLASKTVDHAEKSPQTVAFAIDDFDELEVTVKFEPKVIIRAVDVEGVQIAESEQFCLFFGNKEGEKEFHGSGKTARCTAEGALDLQSKADIAELIKARGNQNHFKEDSKGFIIVRPVGEGRSFRVFRPPLLAEIEKQWKENADAPGRWTIQVRADGTRAGAPVFVQISQGECSDAKWARLKTDSRKFCDDTMRGPGVLSRIYLHDDASAERVHDYLNAWGDALSEGSPGLALAHTLEVQDVGGKTIGLIVLPSHPVRVAWQAGYDALALHSRFDSGMPSKQVRNELKSLDSSHFPSMLPGLMTGTSFVFADSLGIIAAALVLDTDREPKAAVSTLAMCFGTESPEIAPSVGRQTSRVIAKEIESYLKYHERNRLVQINALRAGDGATVVRALGMALRTDDSNDLDDDARGKLRELAYSLNLFPSSAQQAAAGRFLTRLTQRRRTGSGGIEKGDEWILNPLDCGGNRHMPRLRWARRNEDALVDPALREPAHLSLAFDTFVSRSVAVTRDFRSSPLHVYGLTANLEREFSFHADAPVWEAWICPEQDGDKHPAARAVTERLNRVHAAVLRAVSKSLGAPAGWPVLRTELTGAEVETLRTLHDLSDWVVTVDRNAGVEYFDSPREASPVYDSYVIDAVPERDDLGCLQLITSTSHLDEVRGLLDQALALMGLSSSRRNCEFLLHQLKALSGRLAMRLASATVEAHAKTSGELVALALARAQCQNPLPDECWLPLEDGFFIPLDDVRDLLPMPEEPADSKDGTEEGEPADEPERGTRADLLYVSVPARGALIFRFIEVKYRRHLSLARSLELVRHVGDQASSCARRWMKCYFDPECPPAVRSLRCSRLVRALRFYLDKAVRHHVDLESLDTFKKFSERVSQELDRMLRGPSGYVPFEIERPHRGYIFCPDFEPAKPERLFPEESHDTAVYLFGPSKMPDVLVPTMPNPDVPPAGGGPEKPAPKPAAESLKDPAPRPVIASGGSSEPEAHRSGPTDIVLGKIHGSETAVNWSVDIAGNPHLMIVGLPGMGKTTCLVNVCRQLRAADITPIVFSYHDDIDGLLAAAFPDLRMSDCQSLGFNPMRVTDSGPLGHIESAGQLRDIFAAIFSDLGDLQLETIRAAIKSAYEAVGWGKQDAGSTPSTPPFRSFFKKLQSPGKTDTRTQTLLARLTELDDFRFFSDSTDSGSLLDDASPVVLQIHKTNNAAVQRAYASFAFYRIYQDMFRRGRQKRITHAVIFDEAHRAARLKLIPTMAKECRKYGIALVLASQEAKDFDISLFSAIANYLILRVTENDAKTLARNVASSDVERRVADRLKQIAKFQALYFCEGQRQQVHVDLASQVLT